MSHRELCDIDSNGLLTYTHFDADGNLEAIEYLHPFESDILDANQAARTDGTNGYGESREWQHKYRLSPATVFNMEQERGLPFGFLMTKEGFVELLKMLKDPDYGKLRVDK